MNSVSTYISSRPRLKRTLQLVLLCGIGVAIVWYYVYTCERDFIAKYSIYSDRSQTHAQAAFLPGSVSNGVRQELNQTLADVLGRKMSSGERAALAEHGLLLLKEADTQVDAIASSTNAVGAAISDLKKSASLIGNIQSRDLILQIVTLAQKEESAIEDIRGLSYRSNFHTAEIFTRILTDRGELTRDYVIQLNDQIPKLEEQFNKRSNLYTDLEGYRGQIGKLYSTIAG